MKDIRYRILFLASWYPSRLNKVLGIFVKRKAEAVSQKCDVALIAVIADSNLKDKNYEVEQLTENNVYTVRVYFKNDNSLLGKILYNLRYFKAHYIGLKKVRTDWGKFDLIHVNVVDRSGFFALLLFYIKRMSYVITEHSTPEISFLRGESHSTNIPLLALKKLVIKNAECINVDSRASLEYWQKAGLHGNYRVIPNVVDIDETKLFPTKPISSNTKSAVHISNLVERKNVEGIIRAYAKIFYEYNRKDIVLKLVGEGAQKEYLINLSKQLNVLDKCVFFLGYVDEDTKNDLIVNSDFHVLNSSEEGFSVVTAEAICYGIPVIATACGGPEDFVNELTGLLIPRNKLDELVKAILFMLDNSYKYDRAKLQTFGRENYNDSVICSKTYEMYRDAISVWKAGNTAQSISIKKDWKVLDVGSGHQPFRRANFLLERYLGDTIHRTIQKVENPDDKEMIVGDALIAPFKDKEIDYVVASHIAEHVDDPVKFCNELQRISKRGYIETPGPVTEFFLPTKSHKWIVKREENSLIFKKNKREKPFSQLFYNIFYMNRIGYTDRPFISNNILLKFLNFLIIKTWKFIPHTYAKLEWKDSFSVKLIDDE